MPELLLSCQDLTKAIGGLPLFERLSLGIYEADHIGLVGPNGAGKTTLLRILAGLDPPSAGVRSARKLLRLGYVPQDPAFAPGTTVDSVLRSAIRHGAADAHEVEGRLAVAMGRAGFSDGGVATDTLSGGWKKRLAIAVAVLNEPELLLLDEPTNHLDVDGILWLEGLLRSDADAFLAVSHDRYFLESVASRVLELNKAFASGLLDVRGGYREYLAKKDEVLANQASYQESLRNRVRGELDWLSRKARARTRKSQARIDEATRLQDELADLDGRAARAGVGVDFASTDRKSKRLLVATGVGKSFGERTLLRSLDLVLEPGLRLGLLGANGSGKTTVLRLLAGLESPDAGTVEPAPDLRIVFFDQHRSRLRPDVSLRRTLAPEGDSVPWEGRMIHVAGWAKRFLFRPDQLDVPVGQLSGGEQARVMIARLMLEPADFLLLDEPGNDLDIPTLEILEESLLAFPGAMVLVTHDRYLLERVCTTLRVLDGQGGVEAYAGYAQWEAAQRTAPGAAALPDAGPLPKPAPTKGQDPARKKLGYHEQRDWEQMEARILEAEEHLAACQKSATDPAIASDHEALTARLAALADAQDAVDRLYARWAELEARVLPQ